MRKPESMRATYSISPGQMTRNLCQHDEVRRIAETIDKEGKQIKFERCEQCGLLMRKKCINISPHT